QPNGKPYESSTRADYRKALKMILLYLEDLDDRLNSSNIEVRNEATKLYKYLRKSVKGAYKRKPMDSSDLINDEDFQNIISQCHNPMTEAILFLLYYTGMRISELLNMRIKHINFKDNYATIWVLGKNNTHRTIPVVEALPSLLKWLHHHPHNQNPEALVWISKDPRFYGRPLKYMGVRRAIERAYEKAGYLIREARTEDQKNRRIRPRILSLKKRMNPHLYRKSCATHISTVLKVSEINNMMGWEQGSKQAQIYVHLSGIETEDAYLQSRGMIEEKKPEPPVMNCKNCGKLNLKTDTYCYACKSPLSAVALLKQDQEMNDAINESMDMWLKIMSNKELRERFEEFERQSKKHEVKS
ncbi:MAG: tyrosine-type recombinase/integrase, partial [Candidatus Nanoarchaeia archaeon]